MYLGRRVSSAQHGILLIYKGSPKKEVLWRKDSVICTTWDHSFTSHPSQDLEVLPSPLKIHGHQWTSNPQSNTQRQIQGTFSGHWGLLVVLRQIIESWVKGCRTWRSYNIPFRRLTWFLGYRTIAKWVQYCDAKRLRSLMISCDRKNYWMACSFRSGMSVEVWSFKISVRSHESCYTEVRRKKLLKLWIMKISSKAIRILRHVIIDCCYCYKKRNTCVTDRFPP